MAKLTKKQKAFFPQIKPLPVWCRRLWVRKRGGNLTPAQWYRLSEVKAQMGNGQHNRYKCQYNIVENGGVGWRGLMVSTNLLNLKFTTCKNRQLRCLQGKVHNFTMKFWCGGGSHGLLEWSRWSWWGWGLWEERDEDIMQKIEQACLSHHQIVI